MSAILNFQVANGFYQKSNLQGVCVSILVLVSRNERFSCNLQLSAALSYDYLKFTVKFSFKNNRISVRWNLDDSTTSLLPNISLLS